MTPEIKYGTFTTTSGPADVNVNLGFIPDKFVCYEADGTEGEKNQLLYLATAGTGKGWRGTQIDGSTADGTYSFAYASSSFITEYTQTLNATVKRWTASTAYAVGDYVIPHAPQTPSNLQSGLTFAYKVTTAGTSDSTEPTWSLVLGATSSSDNGVYYQTVALGGSSTSFDPSVKEVQALGVTIPLALLKASTTYHYEAIKQVT